MRKIGPFFFFYVFFIIGLVTLFKGLKNVEDLDLTLAQSLLGSVMLGLLGAGLGAVLLRRARAGDRDVLPSQMKALRKVMKFY